MLGFFLTLVIILMMVVVLRQVGPLRPLPTLTTETLSAAEARWQEAGPKSYSLNIKLGGKRPGRVTINVLDGKAAVMMRDGVSPARKETWNAWTVEGMFDTLRQELELAEKPERGFGVADRSQVIQRCEFHRQLSYPVHYQRYVLGTDQEIEWKVESGPE